MKTQEFIDTDLIASPRPSESATAPVPKIGAQASQSQAEIDARVEQARQQILELRRQQEDLERERQELEELRRREEEFEHGKAEMLDELSRTITAIEHEEFELNKKATTLGNFREVFQDYVRQLQDIRETEWRGDELKGLLAKSVSVVEAARAELNKGRAQLSILGEGPLKPASSPVQTPIAPIVPQYEPFDFATEFHRGLARYGSLILFGVLALFLLMMFRGK